MTEKGKMSLLPGDRARFSQIPVGALFEVYSNPWMGRGWKIDEHHASIAGLVMPERIHGNTMVFFVGEYHVTKEEQTK